MILTCPSCQSRFKVPDGSLGTEGRRVRCGDCRHVWHALPEPVEGPHPTIDPALESTSSADAPSSSTNQRQPRTEMGPISDASAWAPRPGANSEPKTASRRLVLGWGLLVAVIVGLAVLGWFSRDRIVATVPETRPLYETLGVPLADQEPRLEVHEVVSLRRTVEGQEQLQVQGLVINEGAREVAVPEMRAVINDTSGNELHSWTFRPEGKRLAPGESAEFSTATEDPPAEGTLSLIFLERE